MQRYGERRPTLCSGCVAKARVLKKRRRQWANALEPPHLEQCVKVRLLESRLSDAKAAFRRRHGLSHEQFSSRLMTNAAMSEAADRIVALEQGWREGAEYCRLLGEATAASLFVHQLAVQPAVVPQAAALARREAVLQAEKEALDAEAQRLGANPVLSLDVAQYHSRRARWQVAQTNVLRKMQALYATRETLVAELGARCCPYAVVGLRCL